MFFSNRSKRIDALRIDFFAALRLTLMPTFEPRSATATQRSSQSDKM